MERRAYSLVGLLLVMAVIVVSHWMVMGCWSEPQREIEPWIPSGNETADSLLTRTSSLNRPKEAGVYYEAEVPDTLDLAEKARLGLNYFTNITQPDLDYEMYFGGDFNKSNPPSFYAHVTSLGACQCKAMEAMCFERLMSGSQQGLEREAKMLEMMVSFFGEDGLHWIKQDVGKKPWMQIPEPFAMVHGQGRIMRAMIAWHQYTGNPSWKNRIEKMVDGYKKMVVEKDDYAYIPVFGFYQEEYLRSCLTPNGWKDTTEPTNEKFGEEGSLFNHQAHIPGALATWYHLTGNKRALELACKLVRFYTLPKFWADYPGGDYPGVVGTDHAHWTGHPCGHLNVLRAILDEALATHDPRLMLFAREGYEWTRQSELARIGYVGDGQGCNCGRLIGLAVKLSEAGIGDYWEDIDLYIRNHGTEMQILPEDEPHLRKLCEGRPPFTKTPERFSDENLSLQVVGGYAGRPTKHVFWLCCGTHGNMGLFYAWDAIVRYHDGTAKINLLLNRASPWLDIDSYLPYEGKVVIRNKTAKEVYVRIPLWAGKNAVHASLSGNELSNPTWFGRYLHVTGLKPQDILTIEFPMEERVEKWRKPPAAAAQPPAITDGKLTLSGLSLILVNDVELKDGKVSMNVKSNSEAGIILRVKDRKNYLLANHGQNSIYFHQVIDEDFGPLLAVVPVEGLGEDIHLSTEVNGNHAVFTISDGPKSFSTKLMETVFTEAGRVGVFHNNFPIQVCDDFQVVDENGKVIFLDNFDRPNGQNLGNSWSTDFVNDAYWTINFKGNTLVSITPDLVPGSWLYRDRVEKYNVTKAPMKKILRYVTPTILKW